MDTLLQEALETFPNFVVIDEKGTVVYLNEIYATLLGTTAHAAIGRPVADVIPNTRLNEVVRTGKEEISSVMTLFDHFQGKNVTLVCNRIPIFRDGKVVGAVAATTIRDIREVAKLYEEIEQIKSENNRYRREINALSKRLDPLERVIGTSSAMKQIKRAIVDYADSNLAILITGETGVGKEVFAKAIHQMSARAMQHYVKINCAAIPPNLLESELFGYADGAFTGALKGGKLGKFELAENGTLLLDEIAEMPMELQSKLLRVLQEKEFERVGSNKTVKLNVRILCSTNRNLEKMIRDGLFREDLYYRINVVELAIPPLRERGDDIVPLSQFFIQRINQENNYHITGLADSVVALFRTHTWPGNVRELEHAIERAAVVCREGTIELVHCAFLRDKIKRCQTTEYEAAGRADNTLHGQTQQLEKDRILQALAQTGGNKTKAAKLLDIDRSMLYHKLKKHNIAY